MRCSCRDKSEYILARIYVILCVPTFHQRRMQHSTHSFTAHTLTTVMCIFSQSLLSVTLCPISVWEFTAPVAFDLYGHCQRFRFDICLPLVAACVCLSLYGSRVPDSFRSLFAFSLRYILRLWRLKTPSHVSIDRPRVRT